MVFKDCSMEVGAIDVNKRVELIRLHTRPVMVALDCGRFYCFFVIFIPCVVRGIIVRLNIWVVFNVIVVFSRKM